MPPNNASSSSVTVSRSNTPEERKRSIKLTVKLPSSKLREVMTERDVKGVKAFNTEGKYWANKPQGLLRKRTQKNYKIPEPSDDEEDDDDDDDDEVGEDEADEPMDDFAEVDAEPEISEEEDADGDAEEDVDMDEPTLPPPPKIKLRHTATSDGKPSKPKLVVTPAQTGPVKSVGQKEAEIDPGDDEEGDEDDEDEDLSELNSDEEGQPDETNLDDDGEGDGEEDDIDGGDDLDGEDGDIDLDSDGMTPGSGAATPDLAKMTKRQRREDEGFMALDMAPQVGCSSLLVCTIC
jgi:Ino eighty subunit 2